MPSKVLWTPHQIDTDLFHPGEKDPSMVLFVGRDSPEKNVWALMSAVAGLGWAQLHLVGGHHVPVSTQQSPSSYITRYGWRDQTFVAGLMSRAAFFVLPSLYEQSSKVLLEAMASGCSVIATLEASRGVITEGVTGYHCDPDADGIREALELAYQDPKAEQVRREAREYILRYHRKKSSDPAFSACVGMETCGKE